ncbi:Transmembrane protein 35 [Echinococcus granulosus]|uniref:Novel acetylcholine receptor chaperone n=1 Tax=Echinococcus granulosus TaxID=6210 RepID=W6U805_ECHGR|nr:Transmembrane protein 35 [Echinococcus granulosus]EUB57295.1 Transmembrane protein 35 [Echinococcus granulosus]
MSDVALKSISIIIGAFFALFGVLKVAPLFSADLYHDMRGIFARSAKVFPLQRFTGWRPEADAMRRFCGAVEMVCGVVLMVGRVDIADMANVALMVLLFFILFANWALGEGLKEASHAIVLGLVLTCRFVIRLQTLQRNELDLEAMDRNQIDVAFRKELRRRIAELHESVCETQKIIKEGSKAENDWTARKKTQGKVGNRYKKQGISIHGSASKKND